MCGSIVNAESYWAGWDDVRADSASPHVIDTTLACVTLTA